MPLNTSSLRVNRKINMKTLNKEVQGELSEYKYILTRKLEYEFESLVINISFKFNQNQ